jgi:hypothetical protein
LDGQAEAQRLEALRLGGLERCGAEVQIGAVLLCKSAKVEKGPELGLGLGLVISGQGRAELKGGTRRGPDDWLGYM